MQYNTRLLRHLRRTIGRNIHHHRTVRRLPLYKLARQTHIPADLIDHYELGKNDIPLEQLLRIACTLNIEPAELLKQRD